MASPRRPDSGGKRKRFERNVLRKSAVGSGCCCDGDSLASLVHALEGTECKSDFNTADRRYVKRCPECGYGLGACPGVLAPVAPAMRLDLLPGFPLECRCAPWALRRV